MENIRKEYLRVEQALNNLLETAVIKNDSSIKLNNKYPKIMAIHTDAEGFIEDYNIVKDFISANNKNKAMLEQLKDIVDFINFFFSRSEVSLGRSLYYQQYFDENPIDAIKIIVDFISDKKADKVSAYLYMNMMHKEEFFAALKAVEKNDKYLYEQYNNKIQYLEDTKFDRAYNNLKEIARGIETGYLSDGTEFDEIQFWKLVPFKYSKGIKKDFEKFREINPEIGYIGNDNFYMRIQAFVDGTMPDKAQTILGYMREKRLFSYTYLGFKDYKKLHKGKTVRLRNFQKTSSIEDIFNVCYGKRDLRKFYDEYYIDENIQNKVLKEVLEQGLPHIIEIYQLLEKRYINKYFEKQTESLLEKEENKETELLLEKEEHKELEQKKILVLTPFAQAMIKNIQKN